MVARLHEAVAAVCPIVTARRTGLASGSFDPAPDATPQQIAAGQAALAAFDWSQGAQDAWQLAQDRLAAQARWDQPDERLLKAVALVLLDELNTLRAQHGFTARTAAQVRTAIRQRLAAGDAD